MAIYNAARHCIESNDGRLLAQLSDGVTGEAGFRIADGWGDVTPEVESLERRNAMLADEINGLHERIDCLKLDLEAALAAKEMLEAEVRVEKGQTGEEVSA